MDAYMPVVINIGIPLFLIFLALFTGSTLERRHYRSIDNREARYSGVPVINSKKYPQDYPVAEARFVYGSVVISYDYFKRFLAGLRMIFGGEVKSYVSLVDRGRREAVLRMKEQCPDANLIVNMRIETSSISKGQKKKLGAVEVFAYGTALRFSDMGI